MIMKNGPAAVAGCADCNWRHFSDCGEFIGCEWNERHLDTSNDNSDATPSLTSDKGALSAAEMLAELMSLAQFAESAKLGQ